VRASKAWRDAGVVAAFYGVRREPHTAPLIDAAIAEGKELWLPAVQGHALAFARVRAIDELVAAGFGLREPVPAADARSLGALAPSLVLVPGLGFAKSGARIGFGRGHYDRALAPLWRRRECVRMGVCFASFVDPPEGVIPMDAHDVPMHQLATELGIIVCDPQ
jgi:5-formyltetrahydrofolate cyclo-ligase